MKLSNELGKMIRQERLRKGMTQKDLADAVGSGVDRAYISQIESGKSQWPQEYIVALADALDLSEVNMAVAAGLISMRNITVRPSARYAERRDAVRQAIVERLDRANLTAERARILEDILDRYISLDERAAEDVAEMPNEVDDTGIRLDGHQ